MQTKLVLITKLSPLRLQTRICVSCVFGVRGSLVVSVLDCQSLGSGFKPLHARVEMWFEISVPSAPSSQLSYDEYTDSTLSVGR